MNNKIAVVHTNTYGAGFSTWYTEIPKLAFDKRLVELVYAEEYQRGDTTQVDAYLWSSYEIGGGDKLTVTFVEKGRPFLIREYDGFESIIFLDELTIYNR